MSNSKRLPSGGFIDRSKSLRFRFNGSEYGGFQGDTVASALMANGVDVIHRSFKYHRPRGISNIGYADSALVQRTDETNTANLLAATTLLHDGMGLKSVNCWPSVNFDLASILQLMSPVLPSGFYYKTFMWPNWFFFEPFIRRMAGFGTAPKSITNQHHESRFAHCEVLVVGAGPTGLSAAWYAAKSGARVILVDDMQQPGGCLQWKQVMIDDMKSIDWVNRVVAELKSIGKVTLIQNATAWGYHEGNMVTVAQRDPRPEHLCGRNWKIWAKQVVLATGAIERSIAFENNDRPGVISSSAASHYIFNYGVVPGSKAVIFTNNDYGYQSALDLHKCGVEVAAIVDSRNEISDIIQKLVSETGIKLQTNSVVQNVAGTNRVKAVRIFKKEGKNPSKWIDCDTLCVSGGWNPAVHLFSQARGTLKFDDRIASFIPDQAVQKNRVAGGVNGNFSIDQCIKDGARVGIEAAKAAGYSSEIAPPPQVELDRLPNYNLDPLWTTQTPKSRTKAFVDFVGDVTVGDVELAMQEGYGEIEHLKRYTTLGMGIDQGKTANVLGIGIVAERTGVHPNQIGTTTFRPPFAPIEFGAIAGSRRDKAVLPYRHTPMTQWHISAGAVMYEAGARWRRPGYYLRGAQSMDEAVERECLAVRERVGIYDGSPLGKFELKGPDAVELLNLVYTNSLSGLSVGEGRYGLMLTEDGLIFDDGVAFRVDKERYLVSSSTGNAPVVERMLARMINVECPGTAAVMTPVTTQWANATVCGPLAREMLLKANSDIDFSADALPFMHMTSGKFHGIPTRVFRVSFTGELSFEINVPRKFGLELWEYLMGLGQDYAICPVGSEANHVLRIEKGFISLAHEVDGTVDPIDLGMRWVIDQDKTDFIGKRAMELRRRHADRRYELVGFLPEGKNDLIPEGSPVVLSDTRNTDSDGFVSACVYSPTCKRVIGLGLLSDGRSRIGETVFAKATGQTVSATVTQPRFYDPKGDRLRM